MIHLEWIAAPKAAPSDLIWTTVLPNMSAMVYLNIELLANPPVNLISLILSNY